MEFLTAFFVHHLSEDFDCSDKTPLSKCKLGFIRLIPPYHSPILKGIRTGTQQIRSQEAGIDAETLTGYCYWLTYSFIGLVQCYCGMEHNGTQAGVVLEKKARVLHPNPWLH